MAKAKPITGLNAHAATRASLPQMFSVRIGELWELSQHLPYPERVRELHDMRIAAKRLRYLFEFFEPCFGGLGDTLKRFKRLQDFLGEIHDCDVWVDYLRGQLADAFGELRQARKALDRFVGADPQLKGEAAALGEQLAAGPAQGLLMMLSDVVDRRSQLYNDLLAFWIELTAQDFRGELTRAVAAAAQERAPAAPEPEVAAAATAAPDEQALGQSPVSEQTSPAEDAALTQPPAPSELEAEALAPPESPAPTEERP